MKVSRNTINDLKVEPCTVKLICSAKFLLLLLVSMITFSCADNTQNRIKPNIIYILADDLGYGDLSCYGQEKIETPNLDKLASKGMRFTQHYAGSTVCAPSRSVLMTGLHSGHAYVRGNQDYGLEGQFPLNAEAFTIAEMLKQLGYKTGAFGKWGLGPVGSEGDPQSQGFDQFFGYYCQRYAHRYYPTHLWNNGQKIMLSGNDWKSKGIYAADLIHLETLKFIKENRDQPFFLFVPSVLPHAELAVPDDSIYQKYENVWEETSWGLNNTSGAYYEGNDYGAKNFVVDGYAPVKKPRATFASMIRRLDVQVGQIMDLVTKLCIEENTIIMFSSDNGPHKEGGADPDFFNSNGPLRGYKRDLYEGGIRVPFIASWPGTIPENTVSDHLSAFWDMMPTIADVISYSDSINSDGISILPTLLNTEGQKNHEYLYWEFVKQGGKQAVRWGDWKAIRLNVQSDTLKSTELYNLRRDTGEENNIVNEHPEIIEKIEEFLQIAHEHSPEFPLHEQPTETSKL